MVFEVALVSQVDTPYSPASIVDIEAEREVAVNFLAVLNHILNVKKSSSCFIYIIDDAWNIKREENNAIRRSNRLEVKSCDDAKRIC